MVSLLIIKDRSSYKYDGGKKNLISRTAPRINNYEKAISEYFIGFDVNSRLLYRNVRGNSSNDLDGTAREVGR